MTPASRRSRPERQTRQHRQPGLRPAQNSIDALAARALIFEKDINAEQVVADEAPGLLQDERIDAYFYTVGHPSGNIKESNGRPPQGPHLRRDRSGLDALIKKSRITPRHWCPRNSFPRPQ
jgi:hypothetical protein